MADRPGTFSLSRVLSAMGVKGGLLPQLSDQAIQPVVIAADFSRTQSPEAVEARAFVSFVNEDEDADGHMHGLYFFSLAPGGCVIERLSASVTQLGDDPIEPISTQRPGILPSPTHGKFRGGWLVNRVTGIPGDPFWLRSTPPTAPPAPSFPVTPAPSSIGVLFDNATTATNWRALSKGELGGVASRSQVWFGLGLSAQFMGRDGPGLTPEAPWGWDPCGIALSGTGGGFGRSASADVPTLFWDLVLPPTFQLNEGTRWYVPPATGIFFSPNTLSDIPSAVSPQYTFEVLWREVPQAIGAA